MYGTLQSLRTDLEEREARLRTQEEEMKQRDAEINRLLEELRRCGAQLLGEQVCILLVSHSYCFYITFNNNVLAFKMEKGATCNTGKFVLSASAMVSIYLIIYRLH